MHWNLSPWKVRNKFVWIWNIAALRTFIFYHLREWKLPEPPYEVSIVGKTPGGRRLQPTENTCVAWRWLSPEDSTSQSRNKVKSVKKFELYSLTIYSKKKNFLTELSYQQLSDELPPIIYPKLTSWFRPCRNLHERSKSLFL